MKNRKLMPLFAVFGLVFCCTLSSRSLAKQGSPAYYEHLPQWYRAVQMKKRLDVDQYIDQKAQIRLSGMFSHLQTQHDLFFSPNPPVFGELSKLRKDLAAHNKDARDQMRQAAALQKEIEATGAEARTEAWANGINGRVKSLNEWEKRIADSKHELDARTAVLQDKCEQMYNGWIAHRKGFKAWLTHLNEFSAAVANAEQAFQTGPSHAEARARLEQHFKSMLDSTEDRDKPIESPIINDESERSAYNYSRVIEQFDVEESKRYAPSDTDTYCNVFARDVAWAMGVELPRGANTAQIVEWLPSEAGKAEGWAMAAGESGDEARADAAQAMANQGRMVIAILPGHVAVLRPGSLRTDQSPEEQQHGPAIAQAGGNLLDAAHLSNAFARSDFGRIQYWYHN